MDEKQVVQDLSKQFGKLKDRRREYEDTWEEITSYVLPRRGDIDWDKGDRGEYGTEEIYDGTAQHALNLLADGLQGYLTSPSTTWFNIVFQDERLMKMKAARAWLQEVERVLYSVFQYSNFYETISEVFLDGGSIGTATMYIEENLPEQKVNFLSRHPKEIFVAENRYGKVDTVFRKFFLLNKEAFKYFGKENFDHKDQKRMEDDPYGEEIYFHAVFPREDREEQKLDADNKKFASYYWKEGGQNLLKKGGYDNLPYVVWRWKTSTEEEYGRSPAWDALSEIKRSQALGKTMTQAAHLAVEPPLNYPEEMQSVIQLKPRAMNPYSDPQRQVFPMDLGGNYPIGRDREEAIQQSIREHFRVDFFLLLSQMRQQNRNVTATEIIEAQGEKAAVLGAIIGRINTELLDPTFSAVFRIAQNAGWFPELPQQLQQFGGGGLRIEYLGPLAQAQRRYYQTQGVQLGLNQIVPLLQVAPNMRHLVNWKETFKHIMITAGMPEKLINDDETFEALVQMELKKAQQAEQMQMAQAGADVAQKVGNTDMQGIEEQLRGAI